MHTCIRFDDVTRFERGFKAMMTVPNFTTADSATKNPSQNSF